MRCGPARAAAASRSRQALPAAGVALDVAGFALGLGLSLALGWHTTDLVWGLWLSSLVIGFASLLAGIARATPPGVPGPAALVLKVFLVAFFAVHFGMFHFVHSVFLNQFFPLDAAKDSFGPGLDGYGEVLRRYWPWLLAAAIAERRHLLPGTFAPMAAATLPPAAAKAGDGESDAAHSTAPLGFNPLGPYRNVIRMHLLIFFFAGMSAIGLDNFAVHAVVYATYFWPWRGQGLLARAPVV